VNTFDAMKAAEAALDEALLRYEEALKTGKDIATAQAAALRAIDEDEEAMRAFLKERSQ